MCAFHLPKVLVELPTIRACIKDQAEQLDEVQRILEDEKFPACAFVKCTLPGLSKQVEGVLQANSSTSSYGGHAAKLPCPPCDTIPTIVELFFCDSEKHAEDAWQDTQKAARKYGSNCTGRQMQHRHRCKVAKLPQTHPPD